MLKILLWSLASLAILLVAAAGLFAFLFYRMLRDPSAKAPLYAGPVLPHPTQVPLPSRYGHGSRAMEIVKGLDLRGRTVVITGGHSGTGLEAVKALAKAGAQVIALARDPDRARARLRGIGNTEVAHVDLLDPASIDAFAETYVRSGRPLHVLINSAAIMATPLERDRRGYERQFATNVFGHYQLTVRLIPALERAHGARIVNLSSRGHRAGDVLFDDINFDHTPYTGMRAYAQTKTALALLSVHEDALLKGRNIRAFAVHPGPVPSTDLFAAGRVDEAPAYQVALGRLAAHVVRLLHLTELLNGIRRPRNVGDRYKTVTQGGATTTFAAVSPDLDGKGGLYLEDCNVAPVVPNGSEAPFGVRPWAIDAEAAERIWGLCAQMTGVRLDGDRPLTQP